MFSPFGGNEREQRSVSMMLGSSEFLDHQLFGALDDIFGVD